MMDFARATKSSCTCRWNRRAISTRDQTHCISIFRKRKCSAEFLWAFTRVPEAEGMNNHEGSWFTSDHKALIPVMQVLAQKHMFFLDLRTTAQSKGVKLAREAGVPVAGRDVFIDDVVSSASIARQLGQTESIARSRGLVIAIGHPHHQTLAALEALDSGDPETGLCYNPVERGDQAAQRNGR